MSLIIDMERTMQEVLRHDWTGIDKLRLGRWGEQFVAMALTQRGFDTYLPAVDDRSVDLLVRAEHGSERFIEVQVKTVRLGKASYVFMRKRHFALGSNRWMALVILEAAQPEPAIYLVPSMVWAAPNAVFVSRDYEGKKSEPEYGLTINRTTLQTLEPYRMTTGTAVVF